jgi:hypothetical protein
MLAFGIATGILVLAALALDEGDVVTLITRSEGMEYPSHVWIVEVGGRWYVRANRREVRWLQRLQEDPAVVLREGRGPHARSQEFSARVVVDPAAGAKVNAAMAAKYGLADQVWSRIVDRSHSVPVRLDLPEFPSPETAGSQSPGKRDPS